MPSGNSNTRTLLRMAQTIEKISAITFRVLDIGASAQFYRNVLGVELLYGGATADRGLCSALLPNHGQTGSYTKKHKFRFADLHGSHLSRENESSLGALGRARI